MISMRLQNIVPNIESSKNLEMQQMEKSNNY